jgi:hypothetical protein
VLTCANLDVMAERYRAPGGWSVEVIHLSAPSDKRDGEWLRSLRSWLCGGAQAVIIPCRNGKAR